MVLKVKDMGESKLIERLISILGQWGNEWIQGPDDAVAFPAPKDPTHVIVWKTDMLVGTTDVPNLMTMKQAGRKTVVMNASDIFVKGVQPRWAVVSIGIPKDLPVEGDRGFDGLIEGLRDGCKEFGIQYLGGDLSETKELIVSMTVAGETDPKKIIRRKGAKVGDLIYTTGHWGLSGIGLQLILFPEEPISKLKFDHQPCIEAVLHPTTNSTIGLKLANNPKIHAGADSSDGLLKTVDELCVASEVGAEIAWDKIPLASPVVELAIYYPDLVEQFVLRTGEEYNHIFAVDPTFQTQIEKQFPNQLTCIGRIIPIQEGKILITTKGIRISFSQTPQGYEHFK